MNCSCQRYDDEQRAKAIARENLVNAERRAHGLQNALEEGRTLLEQADRARRAAEQDMSECHETMSDLTVQNQSIAANKRRLEAELENFKVRISVIAGVKTTFNCFDFKTARP